MDWAALQSGLPPVIKTLLGNIPTEWGDQPETMSTGPSAELDLLEPEAIGQDDRQWTDIVDGGQPKVQETIAGWREVTMQVTVYSDKQTLQDSARMYLERLRARLRWTSSMALLKALGLGVVDIGPVLEIDPVDAQRQWSVSALEVRCAYVHTETDAPAPWIQYARVKSEQLRNAAGTPLPAGAQIDIDSRTL